MTAGPHGPIVRRAPGIDNRWRDGASGVDALQSIAVTDRRYGDDEVREIFTLATRGGTREPALPVAEASGLTLAELQHIGQEAGIEPVRVAQAAASLDARGRPSPIRRSFGMPVGVSRVVDLPRAPTDREWEQLISEFRSTFGSQGVATTSGGLRDWSVGELHISVEPTTQGHHLRLSTLKTDAQALNGLGLAMGGMAALMGAVVTAAGKPEKVLAIVAMFGGISLASFAANLVRLPRWARERERQMQTLAEHAVKLLSEP